MRRKRITILGTFLMGCSLGVSTTVPAEPRQNASTASAQPAAVQENVADGDVAANPEADANPEVGETEAGEGAPVHAELRQLRDALLEAHTNQDIDRILPLLTEDVVLTMQNGERCFEKAAFRDFYRRTFQEGAAAVETMSSDLRVDDLAILYGNDTAVAHGTSVDFFGLKNGTEFSLYGRWTATCRRTPEGWKLAAFHVSANVFDNAVLDTAKDWIAQVGLLGGLLGFVLGGSLMWVATRGR